MSKPQEIDFVGMVFDGIGNGLGYLTPVIVVAGILFVAYIILLIILKKKNISFLELISPPKSKNYNNKIYKQKNIFSKTEVKFLKLLEEKIIINPNLRVFGQIAMEEIIIVEKQLKKDYKQYQIARNRINRKRFDYVVVDKNDYSTICVIELNDKSHNQPKRQKRDEFLREVCESIDLPLMEIKAEMKYDIDKVMLQMNVDILEIFLDDKKN